MGFCAYMIAIVATLLLSFTVISSAANAELENVQNCLSESGASSCHNHREASKLKLIAIFSILVASMVGVCLPFFSRVIPALRPDRSSFVLVKAFSSGVILATGYMHVLPDSYSDLTSGCLPEDPWKKFPFTMFIAMISAMFTLVVDSYAMAMHRKRNPGLSLPGETVETQENGSQVLEKQGEISLNQNEDGLGKEKAQLLRNRVVAQVLELGIIVHSVVIGLGMGASDNQCTIRSLIAAMCFHQLFEGMGLGGCILQAEYKGKMRFILVLFFSITTPLGIVLGIGLSKVYSETSPTALIVVGVLNGCSAGLLHYMALVELFAADFMGSKLQANMKLMTFAFIAALLGAGGMSLMAKWA